MEMTTYFSKKEGEIRKTRADELELYSSNSAICEAQTPTYVVEVLLFLFTHCRWMNTSTARQKCATLSLYYVQNYRQTPHVCCCLVAAKIPRRL